MTEPAHEPEHEDEPLPEHRHVPQKIGHLLDQLGVKACIHDGDFLTDIVVIAKISTKNGTIGVGVYSSEGLQAYDRAALISTAARHY